MMKPLIDANLGFLDQALDLLEKLDPETYAAIPVPGLSSAGAHLRHILDHYTAFVDGLPRGTVDYDRRARELAVERDPVAAADRIRALRSELRALSTGTPPSLIVHLDCGAGVPDAGTDSSVERELQFLVSHTVHHFALIRAVLVPSGVALPEEFGVAPSTLAHRSGSACAR